LLFVVSSDASIIHNYRHLSRAIFKENRIIPRKIGTMINDHDSVFSGCNQSITYTPAAMQPRIVKITKIINAFFSDMFFSFVTYIIVYFRDTSGQNLKIN